MLEVHQFPCLSDNYGYLVRDRASGKVAAVDTPDAEAILAELGLDAAAIATLRAAEAI